MDENCEVENGQLPEHVNATNDGAGPISRSSVTHVAYIVQKFDDVKKDLIRQIGFSGILDLPQITKVDRKFTMWLLSNLDTANRCLVVNGESIADLIDFEVARIILIPCGRKRICPLDPSDKKKKLEFYHNFISTADSDCNSLTSAENNVKAHYDVPMTMSMKDKFKVSFVVWVMGHLLAPTKKHNVGSDRFWGALLDPDEIKQFNWADFVIDELINAAVDVQSAIKNNKNVSTITGCAILLQIIYFESINMGSLNRPLGISPRVKAYDGKSLSLMVAADRASTSYETGNATWGSCVRRLPEMRSETVHLPAEHSNPPAKPDLPTAVDIISDFGKHMRETFGGKMSVSQSVAFSLFHARCTQHLKHLRASIQQETFQLAQKLFCTSGVPIPPIQSGPNPSSVKAARPANSEPPRAPTYRRSVLKNKRACETTSSGYKLQSTKKQSVCFSSPELPVSNLPPMSASGEQVPVDEESDSGYQPIVATQNSVFNQGDIPSFDLGIEFNNQGNEELDVLFASTDLAEDPVPRQCSDVPRSLSLSVGIPDPQQTDKITMVSLVSIHGSSENSRTKNDNKSDGGTTPVWLNPLCGTPPSAKSKEPVGFTTPDHRIQSFKTSPRSLSKILAEGDLVDRMTCLEDSPNINIKPWDEDYSDSPIQKRIVVIPMMPESPWTYNLCHRDPPRDIIDKCYQDVSNCNYSDLNRTWLAHTCPRHIELEGIWIHKSFATVAAMSYDVFDLAIRRLRQLDDMMYSDNPNLHWRHILESEFAIFAMAGELAYNRKAIINQFIGSSLYYRLEDCRMIVVPTYVLLNWSCYFFDFKEKCVHVIDPLYKEDQLDLFKEMHCPNVSKVAMSLLSCLDTFFENWNPKLGSWEIKFVVPSILDATSDETGLLTLMYIRQFDGSKVHLVDRESFFHFKKVMLYELMCLNDNRVKVPVSFTITIDE